MRWAERETISSDRLGFGDALFISLGVASACMLLEALVALPMSQEYASAMLENFEALRLWGWYATFMGAAGVTTWLTLRLGRRLVRLPRRTELFVLLAVLSMPACGAPFLATPGLASSPIGIAALSFAGVSCVLAAWFGWRSPKASSLLILPTMLLAGPAAAGAISYLHKHLQSSVVGVGDGLWLTGIILTAGMVTAPLGLAIRPPTRRSSAIGTAAAAAVPGILIPAVLYIAPSWLFSVEEMDAVTRLSAPPIVIVVADTLRADFVGRLEGDGTLTPNLDALIEDGVVFERAYSTAPWTIPAFASILCSKYPSIHDAGVRDAEFRKDIAIQPLSERHITLTKVLANQGYWTGAALTNPFLSKRFGLGRGFTAYENLLSVEWYHAVVREWMFKRLLGDRKYTAADLQTARIRGLIQRGIDSGMPYFVLGHYMDPHEPLRAPRRFLDGSDIGSEPDLTAEYAAEVRHFDYYFGQLIQWLKKVGQYDSIVLVVTADHGEELDEGRTRRELPEHGHTLFEELIRVPLIVKLPHHRLAGTRRVYPVSVIDIAPTVLSAVDIPQQDPFIGRNLLESMDVDSRVLIAEGILYGSEKKAGIRGNHKVILQRLPPDREQAVAYDLSADPMELSPIAIRDAGSEYQDIYRALASHIEWAERRSEGPVLEAEVEVDEGLQEQLRGLGYLE